MGSHFLRILGGTGQERQLLVCFMNYLREAVNKHYNATYWET